MPEAIEIGIAIMFIVKAIRAWVPRVTFDGDRVLALVIVVALAWTLVDGNNSASALGDLSVKPEMILDAIAIAVSAVGANVVLNRVDRGAPSG